MRDPLMIFAAGFGTRMAPLTNTQPKPLVQVAGKSLLDHTLDLATSTGFEKIVVNAHYMADQITSHLAGSGHTVLVEDTLLDTGGGLKAAASLLRSDMVFTSNSDAIWAGPNPFDAFGDMPNKTDATLLCAHKSQCLGRLGPGDFSIAPDGTLTRGGDFVYLGIQKINLVLVENHPESIFSLNVIWDKLIQTGRIKAVQYSGTWCDVGRPENIKTAESMLAHV